MSVLWPLTVLLLSMLAQRVIDIRRHNQLERRVADLETQRRELFLKLRTLEAERRAP